MIRPDRYRIEGNTSEPLGSAKSPVGGERLNLNPALHLGSRLTKCEEMKLIPGPLVVLLRMADTHNPPPIQFRGSTSDRK